MIALNKIGLNQVQLNQLYLNTLCACQKSSGGDGFPHLRGDVTRWSFKGLTNEQMSKNPRLEDADHKGRFLTFKNFAWGGMSGVGGYNQNFNQWGYGNLSTVTQTHTSDKMIVNIPALPPNISTAVENIYSNVNGVGAIGDVYDLYIRVTGLKSNVRFIVSGGIKGEIAIDTTQDGIYHINLSVKESWQQNRIYFWFYFGSEPTEVTIEQLPHYPGFIIGDGVDDCAVTEKDLDFEDTYTVYTAFIPFQGDPARNMLLCGKAYTKDSYVQYQDLNKLMYYSAITRAIVKLSNGFNLIACKRTPTQMVAKNLLTWETIVVDANSLVENPGLYYLWTTSSKMEYAKAAITGQVICNGHFTSDEEDTKVLNWHKKEYPWLFFDQAWTVVGKSNEDTDRATIANITGNGNNLILSNFGFAENSGYGEYAYNWNTWRINKVDSTKSNVYHNRMEITLPAIGESSRTQCNFYSPLCEVGTIYDFSFKISGLTGNSTVFVKPGTNGGGAIIAQYNKDGVYHLNYTLTDEAIINESTQNRIYFFIQNFSDEEMNLTVEQIPNHDGYLVTDGVDDKVHSFAFTLGKKFTVVGEWEFLNNVNMTAGIVKPTSFFVYNAVTGTRLFLNSTTKVKNYPTKSLKAFCSDDRVYDSNWVEYLQREEQTIESSVGSLGIGINGNKYAQLALKNIAFFNGKYLSKEDCIKAYIYLQTLKAK